MSLQTSKLRSAGLSDSLAEQLSGDSAAANIVTIKSIEDPIQLLAVKQAFSWSLRNMWILYTAVAACGVIASAFVTKQRLSKEHTETKTGLRMEVSREKEEGVMVTSEVSGGPAPATTPTPMLV